MLHTWVQVFHDMFALKSDEDQVTIDEFSDKVLDEFVNFLYSGVVSTDCTQHGPLLMELFVLADK